MNLLRELCEIRSTSGDEEKIKNYLINYISINKKKWKTQPVLHYGNNFQDNIIMVFGDPKAAIFSHIDSIGFTVRYNNEIIKIGGPVCDEGIELCGEDSNGYFEGKIFKKNKKLYIRNDRIIDIGTNLTFKVDYRDKENYIQSAYLDNRLGVYNALKIAESLENGIIVFSTWEEHKGGSVGYLGKFIYENYQVKQALISDITWVTEGVKHGKGCVISIRDSGIPRRSYVNKIISIAKKSKIEFQVEVESSGGSDGNELQKSSYPWDWCFIGAPEDNVHSPDEKVYKKDIQSMIDLYKVIMQEL